MAEKVSAKTAWALAKAIKGAASSSGGSSTQTATFIRKDTDGTCWVRFAGNDFDTPVNGQALADAEPGQTVQCAIDGTSMSIVGNASDPAVGGKSVSKTVERVRKTLSRSVESAQRVADAAQAVADAINQHFWHDDSGAHVTEATQEEWEQSHSGPNSLWNSLGMLFRDGLNNLLALVTGQETGVAIYDGNGNDAENVVASFTGTNVSLGANSDSSTIDMCGGMWNVSVDTSDPVIPVATIKANGSASAAQNVTPTLRMVSHADYDTYSVEYGVEVQTNDGIQYPVSIVHNGDRVIGFGTLGMQTPGLTLTNSTGSSIRAPYGIHMITATGTNSWSTAPGTVLWSGAYHMVASHTATLTYNVSTCHTGIVLHWQAYVNGSARNQDQCYCFVPKTHVASFAGGGVQMPLMTSGFGSVGCKYVYVYDDRVVGAANNNKSGTASGITYNNAYWVLTQIIAV